MGLKLGILGLGNRSTLFYLNELNSIYNKKKGGYSTCPFLLLNTNFDKINPYLPNQFEQLAPVTEAYIKQLVNLGAKKILIPNITLHETIDKITHFSRDLFIHPLELLSLELEKKELKKPAVILGTKYSMCNPYFINHIKKEGVSIKNLNPQQVQLVDEFRTAIYNQTETKTLKTAFSQLVNDLSKENTLVIACTELSVYLNSKDLNSINLPLLQVNHSVNLILNEV
jgi:aspartate racemase